LILIDFQKAVSFWDSFFFAHICAVKLTREARSAPQAHTKARSAANKNTTPPHSRSERFTFANGKYFTAPTVLLHTA
jgi:hypothetical protein